jgi:hypothetical protein
VGEVAAHFAGALSCRSSQSVWPHTAIVVDSARAIRANPFLIRAVFGRTSQLLFGDIDLVPFERRAWIGKSRPELGIGQSRVDLDVAAAPSARSKKSRGG